jgi:hypothetical protein
LTNLPLEEQNYLFRRDNFKFREDVGRVLWLRVDVPASGDIGGAKKELSAIGDDGGTKAYVQGLGDDAGIKPSGIGDDVQGIGDDVGTKAELPGIGDDGGTKVEVLGPGIITAKAKESPIGDGISVETVRKGKVINTNPF